MKSITRVIGFQLQASRSPPSLPPFIPFRLLARHAIVTFHNFLQTSRSICLVPRSAVATADACRSPPFPIELPILQRPAAEAIHLCGARFRTAMTISKTSQPGKSFEFAGDVQQRPASMAPFQAARTSADTCGRAAYACCRGRRLALG